MWPAELCGGASMDAPKLVSNQRLSFCAQDTQVQLTWEVSDAGW